MHLLTKKHLSRRTLLRGSGAAVALPFLTAMVPAATALAQTAAAGKPRLGFFYVPHGVIMERFTPKTVGSDFEMTDILKPLERHREHMTIVSRLANKPSESAAVHAITAGTWLSCHHPRQTHAPLSATTVDQIAAQLICKDNTFPSIEASTEPQSINANGCDRNYGCSYGSTISFRSPTQPLPMENDPHKLFYRLFGAGDTPEQRALAENQYASLLDLVGEETASLKASLGVEDRVVLDNYLDSVREIERQVQKKKSQDLSRLKLPVAPDGVQTDYDKQLNILYDILALSYQGDLTRVVNLIVANEGSLQTYNHVGVPDAHHPLSHHQNNPQKKDRLVKVQAYHTSVFAKFLDKLKAMSDGEKSVLDNSLLLYGGNMGDSNAHDHHNLAASLWGGLGGKVKGNRHIMMPDRTPLANLHLTILEKVGVSQKSFGDSTGLIQEL